MTTGARSQFQLTRLAATYNEIQSNGRILSNRKAMDIIWARVQQLAERIDMNEAPERLQTLTDLWMEFREKERAGEGLEAGLIARKIDAEFEKAYHDYMAWSQMFKALEIHSKMTESEVKIMKDLHAIMTAEDAYELIAKVMAVFLRILQDDPKRLKEAQYELSRIVGEGLDSRFGERGGTGARITGSGGMDREAFPYPGDEEGSEATWTDEVGEIPEGRDPGDIQEGREG